MNNTMRMLALALLTALSAPAMADTLEVQVGAQATRHTGAWRNDDWWSGRGRVDFHAVMSEPVTPSPVGLLGDPYTVFINGQPPLDCQLVRNTKNEGSARETVMRCEVTP